MALALSTVCRSFLRHYALRHVLDFKSPDISSVLIWFFGTALSSGLLHGSTTAADALPWIRISDDRTGFVTETGQQFVPWGVNYDHDVKGRLLEDYWENEWELVERHFTSIKDLGANVVRIHLQFGQFMNGPKDANRKAHAQLARLLKLAEQTKLYLDITGLGCYHKQAVPAWYDSLTEAERWEAQAEFWKAVAETCRGSSAVFFYDLMNEPVVPGGKRDPGDWLGPAFAGKHFVQFITLDQSGRTRSDIAAAWLKHLTKAVRSVDQRHLISVGLVDWSLDRPGLTSGFVPKSISEHVDFLCVHLYPESGKTSEALETLKGFAIGKPLIVEETFPLMCRTDELTEFIRGAEKTSAGWISFYWGDSLDELRQSKSLRDTIVLQWLEQFKKLAPSAAPASP